VTIGEDAIGEAILYLSIAMFGTSEHHPRVTLLVARSASRSILNFV
jgi:hypothetical protein